MLESKLALMCLEVPESNEALLGGGGEGVNHPLSLKFREQLSLIPNITETVIPKLNCLYLWNSTIGGNLKCKATRFLIDNL